MTLRLSAAAERPILPHLAARPVADAEGGGGQREVQEEDTHAHTRSSLSPLRAFGGGDPTVSSPLSCFLVLCSDS